MRQFEELVRRAVEEIPDEFLAIMENVDVQVRRQPTKRQLKTARVDPGDTLLGLYEGVPLTDRGDYNMALPDVITIFQYPIEEMCETEAEVVEQVRATVVHEVAHYFGITDVELEAWGGAEWGGQTAPPTPAVCAITQRRRPRGRGGPLGG
ncbi:MAG: metallopeptidase family protein, partial [Chloroflexota bacterium]|nr:metallopeptidase family protein [Chloroflexota bacterium]